MTLLSIDTSIVPAVRLIGHIDYVKPWKHFNRTINEYILYIVKSGELYIKEGSINYHLRKGDILLLEPNIEHLGYKEASCHYYYIHFKHPKIECLNNLSEEYVLKKLIHKREAALHSEYLSEQPDTEPEFYLPKHYHYKDENELISLIVAADSDYYHQYEGYKRLASLKLLEILIKICRDYLSAEIESSHPQFSKAFVKCRNIQYYLNSNYQNKIASTDIEQNFETNYDYINRIFQKMTGYTILNYLNTIRINRAKELLDATPLKISEVGYLVGIDDPYYFSRLFKKVTGITPSNYIKLKSERKIT